MKKVFVLILLILLLVPITSNGAEKNSSNKYEVKTSQGGPTFLLDTTTGQTWILEMNYDSEKGARVVNGWVPILIKTEKKDDNDKTKNLWVYSAEDANIVRSQMVEKDMILGVSR